MVSRLVQSCLPVAWTISGLRWFEHTGQSFRYAFRRLRKSRAFALTVIVTLALGIGANTAIFSIVDAVLLRPLPYRNSDRLVVVWQTDAARRGTGAWFDTYREFQLWQENNRSFEHLAALSWATAGKTLVWNGRPLALFALPTSTDFFAMLGAQAHLGRTFNRNDLDSPCTLVLSYAYWQERLGAPKDIAGQNITVDHSPCIVVGVMPRDFSFYPKEANAWSLIGPTTKFAREPWTSMTGVFGLLKPGVTRAQAEAELNAMEKRILPVAPVSLGLLSSSEPAVLNLQDNFTWLAGRNLRAGLWAVTGAVALVLLMACLNVANLLLGSAMERSREFAVRAALGAGRVRLVLQMLTESLVLALGGTAAGLVLAAFMLRWFRAANPVHLPPGNPVSIDFRVLIFASTLGVASAVVFGLFPAMRTSRVDLNSTLKCGERGVGANRSARRASQGFVTMQIATSLILCVGAGLLAVSLWRMSSTRLGYRTDGVLTATINLPAEKYPDADAKLRLADTFEQKISAMPIVKSMTVASTLTPMGEDPISIPGDVAQFSPGGTASQSVGPDFFPVMNIPLAQGRPFDTRDRKDTQPVAIINIALVTKYFPHTNPIGRPIKLSRADDISKPWLTIIGVAADVKTTSVFKEMGYVEQPTVYRPFSQDPTPSIALMVIANGRPLDLVSGIEESLGSLDHDLILGDVSTMNEKQSAILSQPRFRTVLFSSFAVLALVLAVVGLYGVLAQMVLQRTRQIAICMALGATRERILGSVFKEALTLAGAGILLGLLGSVIAVRALTTMLYDIRPENAGMFGVCSVVLLITSVLATCKPAWRASRINPMQAIRDE